MRPTLDQIRHLIALEQTGSFTMAARRCHISQPPFSRSIRRLEALVGMPLVSRERGVVTLTPAGRAFAKAAGGALEQIDRGLFEARSLADTRPRLRIGVNEYVYGLLQPAGLDAFAERHPGLLIQPVDRPPLPCDVPLLTNDLDLCFEVTGATVPKTWQDRLESRPIYREPVAVAVALGDPLAQSAAPGLEALADRPLCVFQRESAPFFYDAMVAAFEKAGVMPQVALEVSLLATMLNAVRVNGTPGLLPASVGATPIPGIRVVPLTGEALPEVQLHLAWRRADRSPLIEDFVAWTERHCGGPGRVPSAGDEGT